MEDRKSAFQCIPFGIINFNTFHTVCISVVEFRFGIHKISLTGCAWRTHTSLSLDFDLLIFPMLVCPSLFRLISDSLFLCLNLWIKFKAIRPSSDHSEKKSQASNIHVWIDKRQRGRGRGSVFYSSFHQIVWCVSTLHDSWILIFY